MNYTFPKYFDVFVMPFVTENRMIKQLVSNIGILTRN